MHFDEDTTSTSTPAAPSGPITRARARELNFVMLLKNQGEDQTGKGFAMADFGLQKIANL